MVLLGLSSNREKRAILNWDDALFCLCRLKSAHAFTPRKTKIQICKLCKLLAGPSAMVLYNRPRPTRHKSQPLFRSLLPMMIMMTICVAFEHLTLRRTVTSPEPETSAQQQKHKGVGGTRSSAYLHHRQRAATITKDISQLTCRTLLAPFAYIHMHIFRERSRKE